MFKFRKRYPLIVLALLITTLGTLILAACSNTSAAQASCAFVVGDGIGNHDANLHQIVYPGQTVQYDSAREVVSYVPCNSRNYIINDGTVKNANGDVVGDRGTLIMATTKEGAVIKIWARALFTLNESKIAITNFYDVCFKYSCASRKDVGGDANYSTKGWNGMLAENFGPAMDSSAKIAAIKVDNSIWTDHNPQQYQILADEMAKTFPAEVRKNLGYSEDLFCGSGNSKWDDKDRSGVGNFTCSPVRIVVDNVEVVQGQTDQSAQGALAINQQRFRNAQALYGEYAGYWLGLLDSIDKCKVAGTNCIINIGGTGGGPSIPISGNNTPTVTPTPAKK